jgi:LysM repeat protein
MVSRGETVGGIAALYGSTVEVIVEANGLNEFAFIRAGQSLVVPVRIGAAVTSTPSNTPPVPATSTSNNGVGGGQVGSTEYIVQRGDTLSRIAQRFNTTVAALAQLNNIVNPNRIQVGQRLIVPGTGGAVATATSPAPTATSQSPAPVPTTRQPATYIVQPGDTLFRLSIRFNISLQSLVSANNIQNPNIIFVGQVLNIP